MVEIHADEYYRRSQGFESIRMLFREYREQLPEKVRDFWVLKLCAETHDFDDCFEFLAFVDSLEDDEVVSPVVWELMSRHFMLGKLNNALIPLPLLPSESGIRRRIEALMQKAEHIPNPSKPIAKQ